MGARFIILLAVFIFYAGVFADSTIAQTMTNGQYILEEGNLNSFAGSASNAQNKITFTDKVKLSGTYSGTNYTVTTSNPATPGTGGNTTITPFSFAVSNSGVDFGKITPGEPIIRTTNLSVTTGEAAGFVVFVSENKPLTNKTGISIPDTTCDTGNCSEGIAGIWNSPLTYGFGYRCDNVDGISCLSGFNKLNYFKAFANYAQNESSQYIMQAEGSLSPYTAQITYKVNIPGTQSPGVYQNTISYIALPSL